MKKSKTTEVGELLAEIKTMQAHHAAREEAMAERERRLRQENDFLRNLILQAINQR